MTRRAAPRVAATCLTAAVCVRRTPTRCSVGGAPPDKSALLLAQVCAPRCFAGATRGRRARAARSVALSASPRRGARGFSARGAPALSELPRAGSQPGGGRQSAAGRDGLLTLRCASRVPAAAMHVLRRAACCTAHARFGPRAARARRPRLAPHSPDGCLSGARSRRALTTSSPEMTAPSGFWEAAQNAAKKFPVRRARQTPRGRCLAGAALTAGRPPPPRAPTLPSGRDPICRDRRGRRRGGVRAGFA
jgi:hypothetical protein